MSHVTPLAMVTALALSLAGTSAFASSSHAQPAVPAPQAQPTYYVVDAGTPQEHRVYYFSRLDRNGDGQLSRAELPHDLHMLRAYFIYVDLDGNGKLSVGEYLSYATHGILQNVGAFHSSMLLPGIAMLRQPHACAPTMTGGMTDQPAMCW